LLYLHRRIAILSLTARRNMEHVIELTVSNRMGIHARPAAMIVRVANKYSADILVEKDEEQVNGKSIMGLMMLAAGSGSKLRFIANGKDAEVMLREMQSLFERKFEES
jgi:phosphocarrier protein